MALMTPGTTVKVRSDWARLYRHPGTSLEGMIVDLSPAGTVARVRLDEVQDSWICTEHLVSVYARRSRTRASRPERRAETQTAA